MEELLGLSRLLQFQSEACLSDLCAPGLARLLQDLESLAEEVSCLLKYSQLPQHSVVVLLGRGLHLLKRFLLVHGDLQGLSYGWCSRLRQLHLAEAKLTMAQAMRQWLEWLELSAGALGPSSVTTGTRLRLQLCLHLADCLTLGDTSVEEELATAVLSRLVALNHGCRYPRRTAARALQLLGELKAQAEAAPDDVEGCQGMDSKEQAEPRQQWQRALEQRSGEVNAAQLRSLKPGSRGWLEEQLPGIHSTLLKLLRCGADIEALHLQLLAELMEGQLREPGSKPSTPASSKTGDSASAPPACEGDSEECQPAAKRTKQVGPGQPSKEAGAAAVAAAAAAAMPPCDCKPAAQPSELHSSAAAPAPEWASQVALAKRVLRLVLFRDIVQHFNGSAGRLQQYAALLLLAELFRGHIGPAELAGGDATWQVTRVAAGAAAAAGLEPQLHRILLTSSPTASAGLAGEAEFHGHGIPCSAAAEVAANALEKQPGSSPQPIPPPCMSAGLGPGAGSAEDAAMTALAADGLAHIALAAAPEQLLQGAHDTGGGPAGATAVTQQAQQAALRVHTPGIDAVRPLPQRVLLGCGLQLLAAPDYTSRRLGCNVVSLCANRLAPLIARAETAAGAATTSSAAVHGVLQATPAQPSLAGSSNDEPALGSQRPAEQQRSVLQAAIHLYTSLPKLDESLADLLSCWGIRTRLSALGAVHRIAALAPQLLPLAAQRVPALLRDPHPDAANLGVPQVAAAALGRLAGSASIRARYQIGSVPQLLLAFLVQLACEWQPAGDDFLTGSALWAATEGIEALARLVKPLSVSKAGCGQANAAAVEQESMASNQGQDGSAAGMQQLVSDLVCLQGSAGAVGLLRSLPKLLPDLLKATG
ncbi:hypothetical protein N2152v2_005191 [Parachlorella kessleri]